MKWEHPHAQQIDTSAAIHGSLQGLHSVDLAFRLSVAPSHGDRGVRAPIGTSFLCFGLIGLQVDDDQVGSWMGDVLADLHDARNKIQ
jgi:hypothetical protein